MRKLLWVIVVLLALSLLWVPASLAQGPSPTATPVVPQATPIPNAEERLRKLEGTVSVLEQKQEVLLDGFEKRLGDLQTIFIWLSVLFGAVVAVATIWQILQQRQQQNQQFELAKAYQTLQQNLVNASAENAGRVSEILKTVNELLDNRLLQMTGQEETIKNLTSEYEKLSQFIEQQKRAIEYQRDSLESAAKELCQIQRHNFEKHTSALNTFARDLDRFIGANPMEEELNGQCVYIRGIAAHFQNDLGRVQDYLRKTLALPKEKDPEPAFYEKRLAIANFYLGLNHANLGELVDAEEYLHEAYRLDPTSKDFLTRLVIAEVYVMSGQFEKANDFVEMVENGLRDRKRAKGELLHHELLLLSRAYIMRVDIAIIGKEGNWLAQAKRHAETAYDTSPDYYYASFTLGQVQREIAAGNKTEGEEKKKLSEEAEKLFVDAYSRIQDAGDLHTVTLVRSRIHLLMVAAICGKYVDKVDDITVNRYLDEAKSLLQDLPKIDSRVTTVMSPITKRNENSEVIGLQIKEIKSNTWSL